MSAYESLLENVNVMILFLEITLSFVSVGRLIENLNLETGVYSISENIQYKGRVRNFYGKNVDLFKKHFDLTLDQSFL